MNILSTIIASLCSFLGFSASRSVIAASERSAELEFADPPVSADPHPKKLCIAHPHFSGATDRAIATNAVNLIGRSVRIIHTACAEGKPFLLSGAKAETFRELNQAGATFISDPRSSPSILPVRLRPEEDILRPTLLLIKALTLLTHVIVIRGPVSLERQLAAQAV